MADLLTLGELLIDLTQTHVDERQVRHFAANPGGAPANVAVAAARLGTSAGFIGKVGCDTFYNLLSTGSRFLRILTLWQYLLSSKISFYHFI